MTVVLSAFIAETQTAHDRNTFTSIEEESGRFGWRVQHLFWRLFGKTREEESRANLARFLRSCTSVFCV